MTTSPSAVTNPVLKFTKRSTKKNASICAGDGVGARRRGDGVRAQRGRSQDAAAHHLVEDRVTYIEPRALAHVAARAAALHSPWRRRPALLNGPALRRRRATLSSSRRRRPAAARPAGAAAHGASPLRRRGPARPPSLWRRRAARSAGTPSLRRRRAPAAATPARTAAPAAPSPPLSPSPPSPRAADTARAAATREAAVAVARERSAEAAAATRLQAAARVQRARFDADELRRRQWLEYHARSGRRDDALALAVTPEEVAEAERLLAGGAPRPRAATAPG